MDTRESVIWALIVSTVIIAPVLSQELPEASIDELSNDSEEPVEITTRTTPEKHVQIVESAFERTITNTTGDTRVTVHETPDERLVIEESPESQVLELETPQGILRKTNGSTKNVDQIQSSEGTLKQVKENGSIETTFRGREKDRLESLNTTLHEKLGDMRPQNDIGIQQDSGFEIEVQPDTSKGDGEYVRIENLGSEEVDLDGWRIEDSYYSPYYFEDEALEPGESVYVYTDNSEAVHNRNMSAIWAQEGDEAYLYDDEGNLVEEHSY